LTISLLATNASLPGMLNCCSKDRLAGPTAATPATVSTAQRATTNFLWPSTQRVRGVMGLRCRGM
jgi:hypothetical protein